MLQLTVNSRIRNFITQNNYTTMYACDILCCSELQIRWPVATVCINIQVYTPAVLLCSERGCGWLTSDNRWISNCLMSVSTTPESLLNLLTLDGFDCSFVVRLTETSSSSIYSVALFYNRNIIIWIWSAVSYVNTT